MGCVSSRIIKTECVSCKKEIILYDPSNKDFYTHLDKEYYKMNNYCRRCSLLNEESKNYTYQ